jgi:carbohydrate kinase (thermoresistant glucokinase family)
MNKKHIYIIMGVSGCGKSTIGMLLAEALGIPFFDGDDYHPEANVTKMVKGVALNDKDREGWLQALNDLAIEHKSSGAVIACSALKESYRTALRKELKDEMVFVYLQGSFSEVHARLQERKGHYMPVELLKSQFETLEEPKDAIEVSITHSPKAIINEILEKIA